jgi:hypothetical protein
MEARAIGTAAALEGDRVITNARQKGARTAPHEGFFAQSARK